MSAPFTILGTYLSIKDAYQYCYSYTLDLCSNPGLEPNPLVVLKSGWIGRKIWLKCEQIS